jgi:hypothetical protein
MSGNDKIKVRNIGIVCPGEGTTVWVDHVWEPRRAGTAAAMREPSGSCSRSVVSSWACSWGRRTA